jgi:D-alanyl-D-alanine carboxypeptidase
MPTTKRPEPNDEDEIPSAPKGGATIQDRIAAFVMLDGMTGKTQAEKTMRLRLIGFSNAEIASLLQTTGAVVASNIYAEKKKAVRKAPGRKGAEEGDAG